MPYSVTYAIDSLDPNPIVETFETESDAIEFLHDEFERRVAHIVEHSPYAISEDEYQAICEQEYSLAHIERL